MGIKGFESKLAKLEARREKFEAEYDAAYEISQDPREGINSSYWNHKLEVLSRRISKIANAINACWAEISASGVLS